MGRMIWFSIGGMLKIVVTSTINGVVMWCKHMKMAHFAGFFFFIFLLLLNKILVEGTNQKGGAVGKDCPLEKVHN